MVNSCLIITYMRCVKYLFRCVYVCMCVCMYVQPIVDRVAQNLVIISKNFLFSTRRTRILMGLIIYYLVLIVNPISGILAC